MAQTNDEIQLQIEKYLSSTFALLEMVKVIGHHELSLKLVKENKKFMIRYLLAYNLNFLMKHIEKLRLKKVSRNFYISCATLSHIPIFTHILKTRGKTQEYKDFNKNYQQYIIGYDFMLDFDGKEDFKKCFNEIKEFKSILDDLKVPYVLVNSSGLGFHIIIPSDYLPKNPIDELLKELRAVYYNLKGIYDFESLDESILMDYKQLRKCPYSPTVDGYVCLPLDDKQFLDCEKSMNFLKINNVLENVRIKNRGLLVRTHGLSFEELQKNTDKFLKEYI